jgi:U3 small nucleolar RNA-associated protein 5
MFSNSSPFCLDSRFAHYQIPDLSYRLSTLHTTLQTRLALHPKLLSLNGRLDLLLTQIEMNSSNGPASIATGQGKAKKDKTAPVTKYVEGESSEGDEVEAEEAEEEGSVEDVQLGGSGDEDDSEEDEDEEAEGGEGENWIDDEAMEGEESWEGASESEGSEEDSEEE